MVFLLLACANKDLQLEYGPEQKLDVVIIPGCPTQDDGSLSRCNWQRAVWGAKLWEDGVTEHFITSGSAVYNRFIEAEAIKAGMVELGVPSHRIHLETQALHTDENTGYALRMAQELGYDRIGAATHGGQAAGMVSFLRGWGHPAEPLNMDMAYVAGVPWPEVKVRAVPWAQWMPLDERERLIADRRHKAVRPSSLLVYTATAIKGWFGTPKPPEPPTREPTLRGLRFRDDTRPW